MTKFEKKNGGSGVLFNARLADMSGAEVRLTFFNRACAAALKHVEFEMVVEISGGRVMAEEGCRFREVEDASEWNHQSNLCLSFCLLSLSLSMRELVVADESGGCVKVAVWGRSTDCEEFRSSGAQRFAIELCGCVVKAFADELSLFMIKEWWLKLTSASESWQQCGVDRLDPHGPVSVELGSSTFQALSETQALTKIGVSSIIGTLVKYIVYCVYEWTRNK